MPVTDFDDPNWTPSQAPRDREEPAGQRRRLPVVAICIAIVVIAALLVVTIKLTNGKNSQAEPAPAQPPVPTRDAGPPSAPPAGPERPTTAVTELVPGLWVGSATMTAHSDTLHGIPIGWARNPDGAIGAAFANQIAVFSTAILVEKTRPALVSRIYTPDGQNDGAVTAEQAANTRKSYRLNDDGQVLDARTGTISDTAQMITTVMPRYGAYQVDHIAYGPDQLATEARIKVWTPVAVGVAEGTDMSGVALNWAFAIVTLRWFDGDWRTAHTELPERPLPRQRNRSNQSMSERRAALGAGWVVLADATDKPYDGAARTL